MQEHEEGLIVALYARVSSEEQKEGHTIESQLAELRQFAAQRHWIIISEFTDEAWSGAALARPALDALRDDARKKRFAAVLINDVDRLARDVTHLGVIKRDLEHSGVRVIFRKIPSENSPTHNLLVNILGSFAEFEREMIMDRTRRGRRHKVETRQQFIGALAPYGYRYIPSTPQNPSGTLMINPEEAVVVRTIFNWAESEGLSIQAIADRLTAQGFKPRKGGSAWQRSTVLRILRSAVYTGTWYYNKHQLSYRRSIIPGFQPQGKKTSLRRRPREEWIPVALPADLQIVSRVQWNRVQTQLDRNRCFARRNAKHEYLLASLVRCGGCGGPFCGSSTHGRFCYRCLGRCKRVSEISESSLDDSIWSALKHALDNPELLIGALQETHVPTGQSDARSNDMRGALSALKREEQRVLEAYRLSILSPEQLASELEILKSRRNALEAEDHNTAQLSGQQSVRMTVEEYCKEVHRKLPGLTFETKRNLIRLLIRRITFDGDQAKIEGVIPMPDSESIALTGVDRCGPNSEITGEIATTGLDCCGHNAASAAIFSMTVPIHRDHSLARAASNANLIKANAALEKMRAERDQASP